MKISAAVKDAFRVYAGHFGSTLKFLVVEGCMTLAALTPLLFLTNEKLKLFALLAIPFWLLLVLWARVNAAAAMRDALGEGSLFTYRLIEPGSYGKKLAYGLKRGLMLLLWGAPMLIALFIAWKNYYGYGDTDVFTLMRGAAPCVRLRIPQRGPARLCAGQSEAGPETPRKDHPVLAVFPDGADSADCRDCICGDLSAASG